MRRRDVVCSPCSAKADAAVFGGLGTWVDIYDGASSPRPSGSPRRMAARGVKVVWVETANDRAPADVIRPAQLGRLVDALHARGVRVVAWYLPGHVKPGARRAPVAGDAELQDAERARSSTASRSTSSRRGSATPTSARAVPSLSRGGFGRRQGTRRSRSSRSTREGSSAARGTWPRFPWADLAAVTDAFAPMVYTGGAFEGFDATYGYVTRALRLLRANTGNPTSRSTSPAASPTASGPRSSPASSRRSPTTAR